jgi:hypothetical protein
LEDRIDNLLPLTKYMVFKKKLLGKRGKAMQKGKLKIHITIESNGGSHKKGY